MNRKIFGMIAGVMILLAVSCSPYGKGDKILIIEILSNDEGSEVSEAGLVKSALTDGGYLSVNVDILREIDPMFDEKAATSDSNGQFLVKPAILNYFGSAGWHFVQVFGLPGNPDYYFIKTR